MEVTPVMADEATPQDVAASDSVQLEFPTGSMDDAVETTLPMADEATPQGVAASNSLELELPTVPRSLDETIELCIGSFGWAQFFQAVLVSLSGVFDAQQTFMTVFTDSEPSWHCTKGDSICRKPVSDICKLPDKAWSWDVSRQASVVSEWGLECDGSFIKGLPGSAFFLGCLIGGLLLSSLADSCLGRKRTLLLSCLVMAISTLLAAFSPNVWVYSVLRFMSGFGRATIGTCAVVLATELVGKKWRGRVGILSFFGFMVGFLSLPAMAYVNQGKSWRNLYLWTSIATIVYCGLVQLFLLESPRWLLIRGRKDEAVSIITKLSFNPMNLAEIATRFSGIPEEEGQTRNVSIYDAVRMLVHKPWALKRLAAVMLVAFGVGLVYYGMPLALSTVKFNIYLSAAFNACMDLPANLITLFLVDRINRRGAVIGFTTLGGFSSFAIFVLRRLGNHNGAIQLAFELVAYFSACSCFNIELIYIIELFPTSVRNSAVAMARQALVVAGVFSPIMVAAGTTTNGLWSFGLFGIAIGSLGLFAIVLPETRGTHLSDTMEEEENKRSTRRSDMI